ncbi:hypothetical protein CEXT_806181 [Caerostris extrusa]|uniref:Uncharacterized protein n=1 Tax=Caerostris extrusa TaxID=172846 RepID=A0AAV4RGT1_CAEEX|nr:hypothetical protein CEXT_806181 [Caerostris extrusa]
MRNLHLQLSPKLHPAFANRSRKCSEGMVKPLFTCPRFRIKWLLANLFVISTLDHRCVGGWTNLGKTSQYVNGVGSAEIVIGTQETGIDVGSVFLVKLRIKTSFCVMTAES